MELAVLDPICNYLSLAACIRLARCCKTLYVGVLQILRIVNYKFALRALMRETHCRECAKPTLMRTARMCVDCMRDPLGYRRYIPKSMAWSLLCEYRKCYHGGWMPRKRTFHYLSRSGDGVLIENLLEL